MNMSRIFLAVCLITLLSRPSYAQDEPAGEAPAAQSEPSAAAVAARGEFDAVLKDYQAVESKKAALDEERKNKRGAERERLDLEVLELRHQGHELLRKLVSAGAAIYEVDSDAYEDVNATVMAIAQFYMTGNARGDGGDQYERALYAIDEMLAAGAGDQFPELYLWGGTAAYCTNEFDKARQYYSAASEQGLLGGQPPASNPRDPRNKIWQQAQNFFGEIDSIAADWNKEREIRNAEEQADDLPRVKLTTTAGDVVIELFENEAPEATASFINLVKQGFYDGVVFHRVLPNFMAQGGDPTGTGSGGPGYNIRCECYRPDMRKHFRGSLSMAHAGRDTGGSQFFLTFVPTSFLDGKHTVFGRVIEGIENAAAIKRRDPTGPSPPAPDKIVRGEVLRDRGHDYEVEKLPER